MTRSKIGLNKASLSKRVWKFREIYLVILPAIVWYIIFAYIPIYGLSLAFRSYKANLGLFASPWVGFETFSYIFKDPYFIKAIWRTLYINAGRLVFQFPFPIILALMLNEVRLGKYKKVLQTIFTFPHFLSWVVVTSIMVNVLASDGIVNNLMASMGLKDSVNFLGSTKKFVPMLYVTENWKSAGWTMIIYLAAISGIDTSQYESADIDGASRIQKMVYLTLPGIQSTIVVLFILSVGNMMTMGFNQIFNLSNPATARAAEILDMYIYRISFQSTADFSFSSAVSLFRSLVNLALLFAADRVSKWLGTDGLFG